VYRLAKKISRVETEEKVKNHGNIDLVSIFQAEAEKLLNAVVRGKLLHKTGNIRESGAILEHEFREFLQTKVPSQFRVMQGYLFDVNSKCTPQIDAMIVNSMECHELMTSVDGSGYLPFTSVLAVIEIKNTTYGIKKSLTQLAKITIEIENMKTEMKRAMSPKKPQLFEQISIMFFANSSNSKPSEFIEYYSNQTNRVPTYTVLLDRGIIIANQSLFYDLFDVKESENLGFHDHQSAGEPCLYIPDNPENHNNDFKAGGVLLWLYFTLMAHLNKSEQNQRQILAFTEHANLTYPMKKISALKDFNTSDSFDLIKK